MYKDLKKRLKDVANEYSFEFGKVIGREPDFWTGRSILNVCCYGVYFYDLHDMQVVLNYMPRWVKRYGSVENVGKAVIDWTEWMLEPRHWTDGNNPDITLYQWLSKGMKNEE